MSHHTLCEFFVRRVTIEDRTLLDSSSANNVELTEIANALGVNASSIPAIFKDLHGGKSYKEFKYDRLADEYELCPESIYQFENANEWNEFLDLIRNGVVLMDSFFYEDDVIYSGYGKLVCVIEAKNIPWTEGEEILVGNYMVRLTGASDFSETMSANYDESQGAAVSDLPDLQTSLFYDALIREIGYDEEFALALHCLENDLGRALTFVLENDNVKPLHIDLSINVNGAFVISNPSFSNILFDFEKSKSLVECIDQLYIHLVDYYAEQERSVVFAPACNRYNLGSGFRQLLWLNEYPLPYSPFTEKNRNLTPEHFATHLLALGASSLRKNELLSDYTGSQVIEGYSAFSVDGGVVARFQIEYYSNEGEEELQQWLSSLLLKMDIDDGIPVLNSWSRMWNLEYMDVDPATQLSNSERVFICECPISESPDVHIINIGLMCDGFNEEMASTGYTPNFSQKPLKWFFGKKLDDLDVEAQVYPLMLIPTDLVEEVTIGLRQTVSTTNNFPLSPEVSRSMVDLMWSSSGKILHDNPGINYRYTVFVAVKCNTAKLLELCNRITESPIDPNYETRLLKQGNALCLIDNIEDAEKHYGLKNLKGAIVMADINFYDF